MVCLSTFQSSQKRLVYEISFVLLSVSYLSIALTEFIIYEFSLSLNLHFKQVKKTVCPSSAERNWSAAYDIFSYPHFGHLLSTVGPSTSSSASFRFFFFLSSFPHAIFSFWKRNHNVERSWGNHAASVQLIYHIGIGSRLHLCNSIYLIKPNSVRCFYFSKVLNWD